MTEFHFQKWQATGNDFILMDFREGTPKGLNEELIAQWCHRKYGIGADGFMFLSHHPTGDFEMHYFNADGKEAEMCGNGARSIIGFAHQLGIISSRTVFYAIDGPHEGFVLDNQTYRVKLADVNGWSVPKIPELAAIVPNMVHRPYFLNTGVPHLIIFVDNPDTPDILATGRKLRQHTLFQPAGTNVNFVHLNEGGIRMRTYERGVENETLSCGTGATAAAIAAAEIKNFPQPVIVTVAGGHLAVSFKKTGKKTFQEVFLEGKAIPVFEGKMKVRIG